MAPFRKVESMPDAELLKSISELIEASSFPPILNEYQVGKMVGLSPSWLRQARIKGEGPPCLFISRRVVRYDRDAVLAWFREHEVARG